MRNTIVLTILLDLLIHSPRFQFDGGGAIGLSLAGPFCSARYVLPDKGDGFVGEEELNYLTRFGYLADLANAQVSADQINDAIR